MKIWDNLYYAEESPSCLKWLNDRKCGVNGATVKRRANSDAGTLTKQGYWIMPVKRIRVFAHRIVWQAHYGDIPQGMDVDHINGRRGDNRVENLRVVSRAVNSRNVSLASDNTSGTCGVSLQKAGQIRASWVAQWTDLASKKCKKWFSVNKYGNDAAFTMAVDARKCAIAKLNECGAGYTDRHGKGEHH